MNSIDAVLIAAERRPVSLQQNDRHIAVPLSCKEMLRKTRQYLLYY